MRPRNSITGPLLLIVVGVLFLLNALSPNFRLIDQLADYWPFLLIFWGLIQLIEVVVRFGADKPLPTNGISSGGWFVVVLICIVGFAAFQARRTDSWWRHAGFERGMQAFGREHEFSVETMQKQVSKSPRLVIENFRGDAKITPASAQTVTLTGRKLIRTFDDEDAKRANAASSVELIVQGDTVIVRCRQDNAGARATIVTNMEIAVPAGASVEATGTLGDFDISGLAGNIDISSENAGVRLQDIEGNVKVETRRSDIVRCTNVKGTVDLRGHGEDVELNKVGGQVTLNGSFTGSVALRDLAKPVKVDNMRTEFGMRQIAGEVHMQRGSITMQDIVGPLRLSTKMTDVRVENFTDSVDLTLDKGDVELRPGHLPLGRMAVRTHSGNIELNVPQTAGFAIDASTDHGEISNDFSSSFREQTHGRGAKLEGSSGSGPDVKLETDRGSISIRKTSGTSSDDTKAATGATMAAMAFLRL